MLTTLWLNILVNTDFLCFTYLQPPEQRHTKQKLPIKKNKTKKNKEEKYNCAELAELEGLIFWRVLVLTSPVMV